MRSCDMSKRRNRLSEVCDQANGPPKTFSTQTSTVQSMRLLVLNMTGGTACEQGARKSKINLPAWPRRSASTSRDRTEGPLLVYRIHWLTQGYTPLRTTRWMQPCRGQCPQKSSLTMTERSVGLSLRFLLGGRSRGLVDCRKRSPS